MIKTGKNLGVKDLNKNSNMKTIEEKETHKDYLPAIDQDFMTDECQNFYAVIYTILYSLLIFSTLSLTKSNFGINDPKNAS